MKRRFFTNAASACVLCAAALLGSSLVPSAAHAQSAQPRIYNTVKQKIARGERVIGGTVTSPDPDIYCAMANSGFDFLWIEMQHSPLTYQEVARMIWACLLYTSPSPRD